MSAHRRLLHFSYALPVFIALLGLLVASSVSADPVVKGTVGESVVLPAGLSPQENPSEVEWGWGETTIALSDVNVSTEQFRDRVHLNRTDWSLTINLLRAEDSGEYKRVARAASGGQLPTRIVTLRVYEKIKLEVTTKPSNETCRATLLCTANQREHVSYRWKREDQDLPEHAGILQVSLSPGEINVTFTCIASNPVSEAAASIRESCADDGKATLWWWIYTAATIFLLLVFICIGMVVVLHKKKKRSKAVKETLEPQTIYAEIDRKSTQRNHVAPPSNAQQSKSLPSTVYATVTLKQAPGQSCTSQYDA
ncbi:SLAM family member 8-like isoform X1 [Acipenser oxyrinchus oxyrinchus]|uniref:SLAM family member 8-like isoform X1 n=1 Tax=Acipenser oxyrinchus oxyrinchus TaxID=40147 RepID=A0AAD8FRM8_ACIOX|nr:SLAM family member 8-like isoform X1 [Acipenser oxyrinchus oxyrinchus]